MRKEEVQNLTLIPPKTKSKNQTEVNQFSIFFNLLTNEIGNKRKGRIKSPNFHSLYTHNWNPKSNIGFFFPYVITLSNNQTEAKNKKNRDSKQIREREKRTYLFIKRKKAKPREKAKFSFYSKKKIANPKRKKKEKKKKEKRKKKRDRKQLHEKEKYSVRIMFCLVAKKTKEMKKEKS